MAGAVVPFTGLQGEAPPPGSIIPDASQRIQASPDAFGGQTAQALQGPGARSLDVVAQSAQQAIDLHDKTAADAATTLNMTQGRNILSGDPNVPGDTGYLGMSGSDAMNGYGPTAQKLEDQRQQIAATLNPMQKLQFDADSRRFNSMLLGQMGEHNVQQSKVWQQQTTDAGVAAHLNEANQNPLDDAGFNANLGSAVTMARQQSQAVGDDPNTTDFKGNEVISRGWAQRVLSVAATNPAAAQTMLAANSSRIDPVAVDKITTMLAPKLRNAQVEGTVANGMADASNGYRSLITSTAPAPGSGPAVSPASVTTSQFEGAINKTENGGQGAAVGTSVDGASGAHQITDGTWDQYARPGEVRGKPADEDAVFHRITADLAQRFPNDPARQAVGYFSGPGNVSAPGSAQPFKNDYADGNGKHVSSYVSDVMGSLGVGGGAAPGGIQPAQMSKADYYRANLEAFVSKAGADYQSTHPGDQQGMDQAEARMRQQLQSTISQSHQQGQADRDLVMRAAYGDPTKGVLPPRTLDELTGLSPDVNAAYQRMQVADPEAAHRIATNILTENSKPKADANLGTGFGSVFQRIHADPSDPSRITDERALYPMVGTSLTMEGLAKARAELADKGSVEGASEAAMRTQLFKVAHSDLTATDETTGQKDPKGEEVYLNWMGGFYKAMDAGRKAGLTPAQMLSPSDPHYLGKSIEGARRSSAQRQADIAAEALRDVPDGAGAPSSPGLFSRMFGSAAPDLSSPQAVLAAYRAGKVSRADAMRAMVGRMAMPGAAPTMAVADTPSVPTN